MGIIHNIIPAYPLDPERDEKASSSYNYFHNELILDARSRDLYDPDLNGERSRVAHLASRLD
ncbi:MAG: hypothetical protein F7B18_05100 [Desulfurococcales archaeon]|nr:hypothetical protein [Desulfurococcales archaeon]